MTTAQGRGTRAGVRASQRGARPEGGRGLLVAGMHRSGTSAVTRVLSLCGAQLPDHLMPSSERNPKGYYESQRIYDLHEELLAELGSAWDDVGPLPTGWLSAPSGSRWVDRFAAAVREEYGDAPFLTLKDPRLCRLVPLWLRVLARLGYEPNFVIPVRNPLDVAASLHAAEDTVETKALLLWLQHFLVTEHDTRGHPRSFVGYDALLRDWRAVIEKVGKDLDLAFPRLGPRAAAEIDEFLSGELRHHATSAKEVRERRVVPEWVKVAHAWAEEAAAGGAPDPDVLDRLAAEMRPAEVAFGPVVASLELARGRLDEKATGLEARTASLEAQLERERSEHAKARADLGASRKDFERLEEHLALRDRQAAQFLDWTRVLLEWACRTVHPGDATRAHLDAVLRALEGADAATLPRLGATAMRLAQQAAELARVSEQADTRKAQAQRLEQELSALKEEHGQQRAELERLGEERRREVDHLQQQIQGLWQQVAARDGELGRLRSELLARSAAVTHLEGELEGLGRQLVAAEDAARGRRARSWASRVARRLGLLSKDSGAS
jgi:hypothetical protein